MKILAAAYGIPYRKIRTNRGIRKGIGTAFAFDGPVITEVNVSPDQPRIPRTVTMRNPDGTLSSSTLENMYPFLPPEEVEENMRISKVKSQSFGKAQDRFWISDCRIGNQRITSEVSGSCA